MFEEGIWGRRRGISEGGRIKKVNKTMEEFVEEFKRVARGSGYEGRPLVEEFKRGMNGGIRRKLMEAENLPASIPSSSISLVLHTHLWCVYAKEQLLVLKTVV